MGQTPFDVAVIGGGLVGLATARALLRRSPGARVALLEKEPRLGAHQSGHNSGVIHSGVYYRPGSHKARLCLEGARLLREFCAEHAIPVQRRGKIIVATAEAELPRLQALHEQGVANGVPGLRIVEPAEIREIEPHAAGLRAIHAPDTCVVDFTAVVAALARELASRGAEILTGARVNAIGRSAAGHELESTAGPLTARGLVNCAGLYSDAVARLAGVPVDLRIIPFRGEYYLLRPEARRLVRGLIYPVPDPALPFLGVHLTRTIHGTVEAGPSAVLALAREGYRLSDVNAGELGAMLAYRGFWAMARRHFRAGVSEVLRALRKEAFLRSLQRLVPALRAADITRGGAGVRAQAVAPDGSLLEDFRIVTGPAALHVLNAPSPAATASLAIGEHIADLAREAVPV